jgi:hypothetical protein
MDLKYAYIYCIVYIIKKLRIKTHPKQTFCVINRGVEHLIFIVLVLWNIQL